MTGHEYEQVVASYLRSHGYTGVSVTKGSGDFGVDVIAHKKGLKYAVQCKYYQNPVSLSAIQEVFAGKAYYRCDAAMVVTNSTFTQAAKELANINNVVLIERVENSAPRFRIPLKYVFFVLYAVFIVAPVVVLCTESLVEYPTFKNIINYIPVIAFISCPIWGYYVCRWLINFLRYKITVWKIHNGFRLYKPQIINFRYVWKQVKKSGICKGVLRVCSAESVISSPLIQRKCGVNYEKASKTIAVLEQAGFIEQTREYGYRWTDKAINGDDI